MAKTRRLTVGQALVEFLIQQYTSVDGVERQFFGGAFTIFGHGNVAGIGEALRANADALGTVMKEVPSEVSSVGYARDAEMRARMAIRRATVGV